DLRCRQRTSAAAAYSAPPEAGVPGQIHQLALRHAPHAGAMDGACTINQPLDRLPCEEESCPARPGRDVTNQTAVYAPDLELRQRPGDGVPAGRSGGGLLASLEAGVRCDAPLGERLRE